VYEVFGRDSDFDSTPESTAQLEPDQYRLHPVIAWEEIRTRVGVSENLVNRYEAASLACPVKCSPETFVLRVRGASMEPKFHEGELIFVDPNVVAKHGKYVVVKFEGSIEVTFKQLIIEEGKQYLKALNPDWPHRISEVDKYTSICGVVVFKGEAL
jgi:SOS-response transcriptional repressor LexA